MINDLIYGGSSFLTAQRVSTPYSGEQRVLGLPNPLPVLGGLQVSGHRC